MTVSLLLVLFSVCVEMYKQREGEKAKEEEKDRERERDTDKLFEEYLCDRNEQKYLLRLSVVPTIYFDLYIIQMTMGTEKFVSTK